MTDYVRDVIRPAVAALDDKIAEYTVSSEPEALFYKSDVEDVRRETLMAFALALQSIWERQIRMYLAGCARELALPSVDQSMVATANWEKLRLYFRILRDIPLENFPSFAELDMLQLLGNACRHGDGPSAVELWHRRPDLWPPSIESPFDDIPVGTGPQKVDGLELVLSDLEVLAAAITTFWDDAEYIYNESIERKHESLQALLVKERATRTWLPQASAPPS